MKETKRTLINDIIECVKWCRENNIKRDCNYYLEKNGQSAWDSLELLSNGLNNKKKEVLDKIREDLMEKVIYKSA